MYQQSSSRLPAAGQPRSPTCYNCGASDHFMMACPEPVRQIPAGLAAARAAQAAQSSETDQSSYGNRPYKRQKTGPVVTRFPAPPTGPVVTHYAPPPNNASLYAANLNNGSYIAPLPQPYQQQPPLQMQPYTQQISPQQGMLYHPYGQAVSNNPQSQVQATMPSTPHGYGQPAPNMLPTYGQTPAQPISQYDCRNLHSVPYLAGGPTAPTSQLYSYDSSMQYGQQPITAQVYPSFQSHPAFQGQPTQPGPPYQGSLLVQQPYSPSALAQEQFSIQSWAQPSIPPTCSAPTYQAGNIQYQQPYQNQYRKQSYYHPLQNNPYFGMPGGSQIALNSSPGPATLQKGYNPANLHQRRKYSGPPRPSGVSNAQPGWTTQSLEPPIAGRIDEVADFEWDLEKIFTEEIHKRADPIGHPLPTIYDEEPILPPAYNAKAIICKYVRPNNLEIFARDIRLSLHWPSLKTDPVFNEIIYGRLIPLHDIESWIQHRHGKQGLAVPVEDRSQTSPSRKRAWSEEQEDLEKRTSAESFLESKTCGVHQVSQENPREMKLGEIAEADRVGTPAINSSSTPTFGRLGTPSFGAEDDAWAPQPGEGQVTSPPVMDPTEALLASLGVTGTPKPISEKSSCLHMSPLYMDELTHEFYGHVPIRQDSGYASARGSCSNESKGATDIPIPYVEYRQNYDSSNPPPPPPPPPHMRRQVDGALDSPSSDGSGRFHTVAGAAPNEIQSNGAHQGSSPLTPNSAEGIAHESTAFRERKTAKKPVPIRQVDDVTPKLKRRQPKVADAYSRRW